MARVQSRPWHSSFTVLLPSLLQMSPPNPSLFVLCLFSVTGLATFFFFLDIIIYCILRSLINLCLEGDCFIHIYIYIQRFERHREDTDPVTIPSLSLSYLAELFFFLFLSLPLSLSLCRSLCFCSSRCLARWIKNGGGNAVEGGVEKKEGKRI